MVKARMSKLTLVAYSSTNVDSDFIVACHSPYLCHWLLCLLCTVGVPDKLCCPNFVSGVE